MSSKLKDLEKTLLKNRDESQAKILARYFQTGPGQYGQGDVFLGISVAQQRAIVKNFFDLSLIDLESLLKSKIHEFRFTALLIMINQYQSGEKKIVKLYLKNLKYINNWDLVDLSAHQILGPHFFKINRRPLEDLALNDNHWIRRIAIITTYYFIKRGDFKTTFKIASKLFKDDFFLNHKALAWMLREVGNRDEASLIKFLEDNKTKMSRLSLRIATQKLSDSKRKKFLKND
ncbi:MAG: DNA alkylation repair protein [Patescibacteria group bacterium]|jgi:3-methyladenine DNA glycosylase AlkD